jgi:hypothetical protein
VIEFIQKEGKPDVILFVHGFTGGRNTWKHATDGYFFDQILQSNSIKDNYDVAVFDYYTHLTNLFPAADSLRQKLVSLFKSIQPKARKNVSIEEISLLLRSQIRFALESYSGVVIVAHSMGGLVAKNYIARDLEEGKISKIKLLLSLAVPHLGANLATFGTLLLNNKQIEDLAPLSEFCPKLNDTWVKYTVKPEIKYFYGAYDSIVSQQSAIGTDNNQQDVISCDDDHLSICKPAKDGIALKAVVSFLENHTKNSKPIELQRIASSTQYDDEIFVLKLLLADVHEASIRHSKEYFLNAEYLRKLFSSSADQQQLSRLYEKIRTIYQNSYEIHIAGADRSSTTLVAAVHRRIIDEDATYLKATFPMMQALHKMGMLHQLANDFGSDVWWSEDRSREGLERVKATLEGMQAERA